MSPFLTKSRLITKFFLSGLLCTVSFCNLAEAAKYHYRLNFDARYGNHTYGAPNVATNRHAAEYEQKAEYNNQWSSVLGIRAETEAAYASLPERYGTGDLTKYDSQSFLLRDNYLQLQYGSLRTRVGYQQVVWGEAFGAYFADIVNPKDFREGGLGDLSRNRLNIPMVNLQWIFSNSSVQLLYIPKASVSLLPRYGSDFNTFKLPGNLSSFPVTIQREPASPLNRGEYGFRVTKQISVFDFSIFYLDYYDRLPVFQLQTVATPFSATAVPEYRLLQTVGGTMTADLGGYLIRSELLQHQNRELNTLEGTTLSSAKSNELVYVLGLDLPEFEKWMVSFQYSENRLRSDSWAARKNTQSIAGARIAKTFAGDISAEVQSTFYTSDSSSLLQAMLNLPLSSQAEIVLGVDKFDGADNSELGLLKNASRAWVMFKAALKK